MTRRVLRCCPHLGTDGVHTVICFGVCDVPGNCGTAPACHRTCDIVNSNHCLSCCRYEKYPFQKALDAVSIDMSASVYALVTEGMMLIAKWTTQVRICVYVKCLNVCLPTQRSC